MSDIDIRIEGKAGRITLARPEALNALTYDMCIAIGEALESWRHDDDVKIVVIDAEGSRAFCSGGDIADMYKSGQEKRYEYGRKFWTDEYRINAAIKKYPKPYVAIMDGIVMGGGVGISAHGSHRIVTENTLFAMPECGIGLVPDVGGNFLLSRAPGRIGEYLAASGARLKAADCLYAGIGDIFIESEKLDDLIGDLQENGDASHIAQYASTPEAGHLAENLETINKHFSKPDALEIVQSLEKDDSEWARQTAKLIRRNCPLSVACAVEIVRQSRSFETIEDILKLEYRFTSRSIELGDFIEGIRAQIIDKDRNPKWNPPTLEDVDKEHIMKMLNPLGENELTFV